jgi:hypothetical protein
MSDVDLVRLNGRALTADPFARASGIVSGERSNCNENESSAVTALAGSSALPLWQGKAAPSSG